MILDNLRMIHDSDDGIEFAAAQNKSQPISRFFSALKSNDRDIQASLTLNQPRNLDKYFSDFSNYIVF